MQVIMISSCAGGALRTHEDFRFSLAEEVIYDSCLRLVRLVSTTGSLKDKILLVATIVELS